MMIQEKVLLGDVCKIVGGGTPSKTTDEYYSGGSIPWATVRDMHSFILSDTELSITEKAVESSSTTIIEKGNIIIATRVGLGKVCLLEQNTAINQDLKAVIPKADRYTPKFLFWFFRSKEQEIQNAGTGATVQGVKLPFIRSLMLPKWTITEQKQIVAILDKAFAAIDQAKANIERNIENAKELFQSKLNEVFSQKGDDWKEKTLKQITTKIGSGATPRGGQESYKESGISLIRSMNVYDTGFVRDKLAFIDEEQAAKLNNVTIEAEDVLLNITGASIARCCLVPSDVLPARVNQHVSIIRTIQDEILPEYLHFLLTAKSNKDILLGIGEQGSTRQAITKAQIENFSISYPDSITEQQRIIEKLLVLKKECRKLELKYINKLDQLSDLKKSILQKAFEGELTLPETVEATQAAFERVEGISATDLQAGITALAYQKHMEANKVQFFKHVKAEKIAHLSEYILGIDMERNPVKDAAGPNDFKHAKKVESRARKAGFYTVYKKGDFYEYSAGSKFQGIIDKTTTVLEHRMEQLNRLLELLVPMKTQQAEIVATLYAAWNNLLLTNQAVTDENIVLEARENWHESKLNIPREKFFKALNWMKDREILVPKGRGKLVTAKAA